MGLLTFEKPKKVRSTEDHNEMFSSDSGIEGTYVPNMSEEDRFKWKAKHIKGKEERIEIRKTLECYADLVIKVYKKGMTEEQKKDNWKNKHNDIVMSTNGKMDFKNYEYLQLLSAVYEAQEILGIKL